jgi:threonine synthase
MDFFSTDKHDETASLRAAVLRSIQRSQSLFMPDHIPALSSRFFSSLADLSFSEIAFEVLQHYTKSDVPTEVLKNIVTKAFNFPIPVKQIDEKLYSLELFHGPTRAFKDVGARFMAGLITFFQEQEDRKLTIVVATSGDTGGAVASAFHNSPGVQVVVLFPKDKVSPIQRKQLTTLNGNVYAVEIDGSFDNCQHLAKQILTDSVLNKTCALSSANSINIARLLPQSLYYYSAVAAVSRDHPIVLEEGPLFSVPSGNFGNITAGIFAQRSGLPVRQFIAATNCNDAIPRYLVTGVFTPQASVETVSNAMDVGNPNNFPRLLELSGHSHENFSSMLRSYPFTDEQTYEGMREIFERYKYVTDPHGAIGYLGLKKYGMTSKAPAIFLHTAHPAKFPDTVKQVVGDALEIPEDFSRLDELPSQATAMNNDYSTLVEFIRTLPQ